MWKSLLTSSSGHSVETGTSTDLTKHVQRLIDAPEGAFLIVELPAMVDAFLQFTAGPNAIKMDHPLISDIQRSREQAFRLACQAIQRWPYESLGSDGARFLDCDLSRDPASAAIDIGRVLESLFAIRPTTQLRFVGEMLPPSGDSQSV
jgi:hypothetical protein